eukprot:10726627-Alexandrium_andersonii.AAC.1
MALFIFASNLYSDVCLDSNASSSCCLWEIATVCARNVCARVTWERVLSERARPYLLFCLCLWLTERASAHAYAHEVQQGQHRQRECANVVFFFGFISRLSKFHAHAWTSSSLRPSPLHFSASRHWRAPAFRPADLSASRPVSA